MATQLTTEGTFEVTLRNAHWTRLQEKDGDSRRMSAVLPGYLTLDGEETCITAELMFTRTLISRGRNAGRSVAEVSMETLAQLGMQIDADGFINPARLAAELEGKQARFVCEFEEYEGQSRLRVRFVNAPGRAELAPEEAAAIFTDIIGKSVGPPPVAASSPLPEPTPPAPPLAPTEELPF